MTTVDYYLLRKTYSIKDIVLRYLVIAFGVADGNR